MTIAHQFTEPEPEATVQGKRGGWYHLHSKGRGRHVCTYAPDSLQAALLAELDLLVYEALCEGW